MSSDLLYFLAPESERKFFDEFNGICQQETAGSLCFRSVDEFINNKKISSVKCGPDKFAVLTKEGEVYIFCANKPKEFIPSHKNGKGDEDDQDENGKSEKKKRRLGYRVFDFTIPELNGDVHTRNPISSISLVDADREQMIHQVMSIMQTKSRSEVERELARTNWNLNDAINNLLSEETNDDSFYGAPTSHSRTRNLLHLFEQRIQTHEEELDSFDYSTDNVSNLRAESHHTSTNHPDSDNLDDIKDSDSAVSFKKNPRNILSGYESFNDQVDLNFNKIIRLNDHLSKDIKIVQIASTFTHLYFLDSSGFLHDLPWRFDKLPKLLFRKKCHTFYMLSEMKFQSKHKIKLISSSNIRVTVLTEDNLISSWMDPILPCISQKIFDDLKLDMPVIHVFDEKKSVIKLNSIQSGFGSSSVLTESGKLLFWGIHFPDFRKYLMGLLRQKFHSDKEIQNKVFSSTHSRFYKKVRVGSVVCATSHYLYNAGALVVKCHDNITQIGRLTTPVKWDDDFCRVELIDMESFYNERLRKKFVFTPLKKRKYSDINTNLDVQTSSKSSGETNGTIERENIDRHVRLKTSEIWRIDEVTFFDNISLLSFGIVLKIDDDNALVYFLPPPNVVAKTVVNDQNVSSKVIEYLKLCVDTVDPEFIHDLNSKPEQILSCSRIVPKKCLFSLTDMPESVYKHMFNLNSIKCPKPVHFTDEFSILGAQFLSFAIVIMYRDLTGKLILKGICPPSKNITCSNFSCMDQSLSEYFTKSFNPSHFEISRSHLFFRDSNGHSILLKQSNNSYVCPEYPSFYNISDLVSMRIYLSHDTVLNDKKNEKNSKLVTALTCYFLLVDKDKTDEFILNHPRFEIPHQINLDALSDTEYILGKRYNQNQNILHVLIYLAHKTQRKNQSNQESTTTEDSSKIYASSPSSSTDQHTVPYLKILNNLLNADQKAVYQLLSHNDIRSMNPFIYAIFLRLYDIALIILETSINIRNKIQLETSSYPELMSGDFNPLAMVCLNDNCSYTWTGSQHISQDIYECKTCNLVGSLCCCSECAATCHIGHACKLKKTSPTAYCDCWQHCSCRALSTGDTECREKILEILLEKYPFLISSVSIPKPNSDEKGKPTDYDNLKCQNLVIHVTQRVIRQNIEQAMFRSVNEKIKSSNPDSSPKKSSQPLSGVTLEREFYLGTKISCSIEPPSFAKFALKKFTSSWNTYVQLSGSDMHSEMKTEFKPGIPNSVKANEQIDIRELDLFLYLLFSGTPSENIHCLIHTFHNAINNFRKDKDKNAFVPNIIGSVTRSIIRLYTVIVSSLEKLPSNTDDAFIPNGFGYDALFTFPGQRRDYSETSSSESSNPYSALNEKNVISRCLWFFTEFPHVSLEQISIFSVALVTPIIHGVFYPVHQFDLLTSTKEALNYAINSLAGDLLPPTTSVNSNDANGGSNSTLRSTYNRANLRDLRIFMNSNHDHPQTHPRTHAHINFPSQSIFSDNFAFRQERSNPLRSESVRIPRSNTNNDMHTFSGTMHGTFDDIPLIEQTNSDIIDDSTNPENEVHDSQSMPTSNDVTHEFDLENSESEVSVSSEESNLSESENSQDTESVYQDENMESLEDMPDESEMVVDYVQRPFGNSNSEESFTLESNAGLEQPSSNSRANGRSFSNSNQRNSHTNLTARPNSGTTSDVSNPSDQNVPHPIGTRASTRIPTFRSSRAAAVMSALDSNFRAPRSVHFQTNPRGRQSDLQIPSVALRRIPEIRALFEDHATQNTASNSPTVDENDSLSWITSQRPNPRPSAASVPDDLNWVGLEHNNHAPSTIRGIVNSINNRLRTNQLGHNTPQSSSARYARVFYILVETLLNIILSKQKIFFSKKHSLHIDGSHFDFIQWLHDLFQPIWNWLLHVMDHLETEVYHGTKHNKQLNARNVSSASPTNQGSNSNQSTERNRFNPHSNHSESIPRRSRSNIRDQTISMVSDETLSSREDFLQSLVSLSRSLFNEHHGSFPKLDPYSYLHVAYILDAMHLYIKTIKIYSCDPVMNPTVLYDKTRLDNVLSDVSDYDPDRDNSHLKPSKFFCRSDSTISFGSVSGIDIRYISWQQPAKLTQPLSNNPVLLTPKARNYHLYGSYDAKNNQFFSKTDPFSDDSSSTITRINYSYYPLSLYSSIRNSISHLSTVDPYEILCRWRSSIKVFTQIFYETLGVSFNSIYTRFAPFSFKIQKLGLILEKSWAHPIKELRLKDIDRNDMEKLIVTTVKQLNDQFTDKFGCSLHANINPIPYPALANAFRLRVNFKNESGEGVGVTRNFCHVLLQILTSDTPISAKVFQEIEKTILSIGIKKKNSLISLRRTNFASDDSETVNLQPEISDRVERIPGSNTLSSDNSRNRIVRPLYFQGPIISRHLAFSMRNSVTAADEWITSNRTNSPPNESPVLDESCKNGSFVRISGEIDFLDPQFLSSVTRITKLLNISSESYVPALDLNKSCEQPSQDKLHSMIGFRSYRLHYLFSFEPPHSDLIDIIASSNQPTIRSHPRFVEFANQLHFEVAGCCDKYVDRITGMLLDIPCSSIFVIARSVIGLETCINFARKIIERAIDDGSYFDNDSLFFNSLPHSEAIFPHLPSIHSVHSGPSFFWQPSMSSVFHPVPGHLTVARLAVFQNIGRILGLCLLNKEIFPISFTRPMWKFLLRRPVNFYDFAYYDQVEYDSLRNVMLESKRLIEAGRDDETIFDLDFTIDSCPHMKDKCPNRIELIEDGRNMNVTAKNAFFYVELYSVYRMVVAVQTELEAIEKGFHECFPVHLLSSFSPEDIRMIACGCFDISVNEMRNSTTIYDESGGENEALLNKVVEWFWSVLEEMTAEQKRDLLIFWTSHPNLPASSTRFVNSKILTLALKPPSEHQLPSANTCVSRLYLPLYESKEILKSKILYAIQEHAFGFV